MRGYAARAIVFGLAIILGTVSVRDLVRAERDAEAAVAQARLESYLATVAAAQRASVAARGLEELQRSSGRLGETFDRGIRDQAEIDRGQARRALERLRRERAELQRRIDDTRRRTELGWLRDHHHRGVVIPRACLDNPLARDCW
jgi:hypothetical protein